VKTFLLVYLSESPLVRVSYDEPTPIYEDNMSAIKMITGFPD